MSNTIPTVKNLYTEGEQIVLKLSRPTSTTIQLSWTYPTGMSLTAGALILVSEKPLNPSNWPTDTAKYTASTDLAAPVDTLGANASAQVVGAFYNDIATTTLTLANADPDKLYYASIHAASGVRQYYTNGTFSYAINSPQRSSLSSNEGAGDIPTSNTVPLNPYVGQVYYNPINNSAQMWNGVLWMPAGSGTVITGRVLPLTADAGQFFYNTNTGDLDIWTGSNWSKANTANTGLPMYSKPGVGTDGTQDERADAINSLKLQLGWPKVCVELNEDHFNYAIDNAISEVRHRLDNAYTKGYLFFSLLKGQQTYYLNDPVLGSNKSVDIIKIYRMGALGAYTTNDSGIYNQTFLNNLGLNGSVGMMDLTSIHLMANLSEEIQRLFAGDLMFTWNEGSRVLNIQRKIQRNEPVIVEAVMERTEQDLLTDRWLKSWIREWAHAKLIETLGYIRSKFGSLPGPGGGITLNGSELLSRADTKFEELKRQVNDFEIGNNSPDHASPFLIG